jgi:RNA polymerase sigma-70 factor (ECF subfamily)
MRPNDAVDTLMAQRSRFRAFVVSRLGNEADADDVLQNGLVRALERVGDVRDDQKLTTWFYQLLRNAMIDHLRGRTAGAQREESWMLQESVSADSEGQRAVCACYEALLPKLKARDGELLRRVELNNEPVAAVAADLGMTANNASVILHRARKELRRLLEQFCGNCATGACLDCDCEPTSRESDQS